MAERPRTEGQRGSGMRPTQPEPRYLAVGRIVRPHGVRGELRMELLTDYPDQLSRLKMVYVGERYVAFELAGVRLHQKVALIKLEGCEDRDAAEMLRGQLVYIKREDAVPLEPNEFYEHQVCGLKVTLTSGESLGEVVEVFTLPGANDVLVVHGPRGEVLIPVIEDVIVAIDLEAGQIRIHPMPGLLPDG